MRLAINALFLDHPRTGTGVYSANVLEVLEANGAPEDDLHLVVGGAAMVNLRGKQSVLFKVNEAGTDDLLRRGRIGEVESLSIHKSAAIGVVTKGGGSAYVTSGSTAVGVSNIALVTGSGTVLAGSDGLTSMTKESLLMLPTGTMSRETLTLDFS